MDTYLITLDVYVEAESSSQAQASAEAEVNEHGISAGDLTIVKLPPQDDDEEVQA
mgnify:CR=1 FL=1|tara:strand:+ start:1699 stop:1863 length:165 start_codon:yes stop_codon:yes gene_type:complete